jgi:hypothetical protein
MTDPSLMRGNNWVRCCMCGELHTEPFDNLAKDKNGVYWDICKGQCALESGINMNTRIDYAPQFGEEEDD